MGFPSPILENEIKCLNGKIVSVNDLIDSAYVLNTEAGEMSFLVSESLEFTRRENTNWF